MTTEIDIPHAIGREEARRRMQARVGELPAHIPGGVAEVESSWPEPYRMNLSASAMGQRLTATIDVEETRVRVRFDLPPMLRFASGAIEAAVRRKGGELLLGDASRA